MTTNVCHQVWKKRSTGYSTFHLGHSCSAPSRPYSTCCLWQTCQYMGTLPSFILHSFLIWFWGWETAEENCNRLEVTLQEIQGANKQEGVVRALHEERCGLTVAEKSCSMVAGLVTWTKCIACPIPGTNGWASALLLFLNNTAPAVMCYRTCWPAWKAHEKNGQEMCVETYGFVCLFEKWKYWLQTACLGQSMTVLCSATGLWSPLLRCWLPGSRADDCSSQIQKGVLLGGMQIIKCTLKEVPFLSDYCVNISLVISMYKHNFLKVFYLARLERRYMLKTLR